MSEDLEKQLESLRAQNEALGGALELVTLARKVDLKAVAEHNDLVNKYNALLDERADDAARRYDKAQFVAADYVPAHAYVSRGFKQADGAPVAWFEQESFVPKEQWRVEQWNRLYAMSLQGLRASVGPFGLADESGIRLPIAETAARLKEIATADADAAYGPLNGDAK